MTSPGHQVEQSAPLVPRALAPAGEPFSGPSAATALDSCPDLVARLDRSGRFVRWNGAWWSQLGIEVSTLAGASLVELVHPEDGAVLAQVLEALVPGEDRTLETRVEAATACRTYEWKLTATGGGERLIWGRDVTGRVASLDVVRADRDRYRALVDGAPDLVGVLQPDGTLSYRSGGPSGMSLPAGERAFAAVHPEDLELVLDAFGEAMMSEGRSGPLELRIRRDDGSWGWIAVTARNLVDSPEVGGLLVHIRDVDARRRKEAARRDSEEQHRRLAEAGPIGMFALDDAGRIVFANRRALDLVGTDDLVGTAWSDVIHEADADRLEAQVPHATAQPITARVRSDEDHPTWVEIRMVADRASDGTLTGWSGTIEAASGPGPAGTPDGAAVADLVERTPDPVLVWGADGRCRFANQAAVEALGAASDDDVATLIGADTVEAARGACEADGRWQGEAELTALDGTVTLYSAVAVATGAAGEVTAVLRDITSQREREERLSHLASHDSLTGLANRARLLTELEAAAASATARTRVAVLFLDLDRFKVINDSLGHEVGDHLLCEIGERLSRLVRPDDLVARLGGDEFVVLCRSVDSEATAMAVAGRVLDAVQEPFEIEGSEVHVTTSVGVALSSGEAAETLMENADVAMYRAKERGRDRVELFDEGLRTSAAGRLETETALRQAIERDELRLFYQPVFSLRNGSLVGLEALIRWEHPRHGLVGPAEFIPVAEDSGLIVPMGEWVLREALDQARRWRNAFPDSESVVMHVNLSARQFARHDLVEIVNRTIQEAESDPARLCLEITESAVMDDIEEAIAILESLRGIGVNVGVDDFGTGYSSLSYLKRLPVDMLKIDKSFVARLGEDMVDSAIVASVINLARSLSLTVVAEGVETEQQRLELRALGCPLAQGFYFSRPLPPDAVTELIATEAWR